MEGLPELPPATKRKVGAYEYSRVEEAQKESMIKQAMRDFPDTPGGETMAEWVYDYMYQMGEKEIQRLIDSGEFDKPFIRKAILPDTQDSSPRTKDESVQK